MHIYEAPSFNELSHDLIPHKDAAEYAQSRYGRPPPTCTATTLYVYLLVCVCTLHMASLFGSIAYVWLSRTEAQRTPMEFFFDGNGFELAFCMHGCDQYSLHFLFMGIDGDVPGY